MPWIPCAQNLNVIAGQRAAESGSISSSAETHTSESYLCSLALLTAFFFFSEMSSDDSGPSTPFTAEQYAWLQAAFGHSVQQPQPTVDAEAEDALRSTPGMTAPGSGKFAEQ